MDGQDKDRLQALKKAYKNGGEEITCRIAT